MKIFLIRHGKSDKSLKRSMTHDEFELKRPLVAGETKKAAELGAKIRRDFGLSKTVEFVHSGRVRSRQTLTALGKGLGLSTAEIDSSLREEVGLGYLADERYWSDAKAAIKSGRHGSYAEFFLEHSPSEYFEKNMVTNPGETLSSEQISINMREVLTRAVDLNFEINRDVVMVSHEPVLSLFLSDLLEVELGDLGGEFGELELTIVDFVGFERKLKVVFRGRKYQAVLERNK